MDAGDGSAAGAVALATSAPTMKKGVRDDNLKQFRITSCNPSRAAWIDGVNEPEIAG
jgi:hypothetical protein